MGCSPAGRDEGDHRLTIDRFEGDLAVVEMGGGLMLDLPRWLLPPGAGEGDIIVVSVSTGEGRERRIVLRVDEAATRSAREEAGAALERLRRRDPGGDIEL